MTMIVTASYLPKPLTNRWRSFAALACFALCAAALCAADKPKHRLILCNDGGTLGAPDMEAPIGAEGLIKETYGPLEGTQVDTLYWQLGVDPYWGTDTHRLSDWYGHKTKVGNIWGTNREVFKTAGEWRISENLHQMMDSGTDSAAVIVGYGHKIGKDVFLSLRINDAHDGLLAGGLDDPNLSPLRRSHQDWLLGANSASYATMSPMPTQARAGTADAFKGIAATGTPRPRFQYDFALPQVREYVFNLVNEAIANYDLDGFDLDFDRDPSLFKKGEVDAGLITELVRKVHDSLAVKGAQVGRKLLLSVRVPPDLELCQKVGIDTATWIKQGLVDIVVVGDPAGWDFRLPIEEYVALARGTHCEIIAQNLDCFKPAPGRSEKVLFHEGDDFTADEEAAVAAVSWQSGAHGTYLWNHHFIKFATDNDYDREAYRIIGDPATLRRHNKHYFVNGKEKDDPYVLAHQTVRPGEETPLPVVLKSGAKGACVTVEIADDVAAARKEGALKSATLRLMIEELTRLDQLDIQLNGQPLPVERALKRLNYNDCYLDFDVAGVLRQGKNALTITVSQRNPHVQSDLKLPSVETFVVYH